MNCFWLILILLCCGNSSASCCGQPSNGFFGGGCGAPDNGCGCAGGSGRSSMPSFGRASDSDTCGCNMQEN